MNCKKNKVQHLVVDTNTFIKNSAVQDVAVNVFTVQDVVDEITCKRQLRNLVVLPYNLIVKEVFTENIKFVTEFAKKTGDYISLSATDIKVIALTYQLEKETVGCDHLKQQPEFTCVINTATKAPDDCIKLPGFYLPRNMGHKSADESEDGTGSATVDADCSHQKTLTDPTETVGDSHANKRIEEGSNSCSAKNHCENESVTDPQERVFDGVAENVNTGDKTLEINGGILMDQCNMNQSGNDSCTAVTNETTKPDDDCAHSTEVTEKFVCWRDSNEDNEEEEYDTDDDDDDDTDWITPENIEDIKKCSGAGDLESKPIPVACITSDFAMQNVLKQIGLNVISIDGRLIRQMRTYVLRCYSCFKRTSIMTKVFCPHCGNRTLKKVAVTVKEDGTQEIHINTRRPLSGKGKRFSIPRLRGGKHSNDPILCEDQPVPHQRPSRLACKKTDPLDPDYIAGYSPFVMRDITSKSAMLGIRNGNMKNYFRRSEVNKPKRRK